MQEYTMTKNKHLMSLKAVELRWLVHYGIYVPKDNRTFLACKSYLRIVSAGCYIDVRQT